MLLRGRTVLKSCQEFLFWTFLIHQLRLLGSQQHPQSGVLLTAFSTWGTENTEINMESTGSDKSFNIFRGQKLASTCRFVGGRIIMQQQKISRAECSWMSPLNVLQGAIHYSFI